MPQLAIFGALFPEEFYNPESSPNRVHQAIKSLRSWLRASGSGIEVLEAGGHYRIQPRGTTSLLLPRETLPTDPAELRMRLLRRAIGESQEITASEAAAAVGLSRASAKRLLKLSVQRGETVLVGAGPRSRYRRLA
jgi:hypothetical protein